ncbi:hypothetical protein DL96DRAFT_1714200 [Flagelloscypha sp. PMI_526]|nr:hypothetical protein DL96DRAFT_1714200 [Flagelloscypha sp. PMI_526]
MVKVNPILRYTVFGFSLLIGILVLTMSTHVVATTAPARHRYALLGIASGGLTNFWKEALPTWIIFELAALTTMWASFLTTGALAATSSLTKDCEGQLAGSLFDSHLSTSSTLCKETSAVMAFSFIGWITLFGYTTALTIFATSASFRGHPTFTKPILGTNFLGSTFIPSKKQPNMGDAKIVKPAEVLTTQFTGSSTLSPQRHSTMMSPPPSHPQNIDRGGYIPEIYAN